MLLVMFQNLLRRALRRLRRQPQPGQLAPNPDHGVRSDARLPQSEDALTVVLAGAERMHAIANNGKSGKETARLIANAQALQETAHLLGSPRQVATVPADSLLAA